MIDVHDRHHDQAADHVARAAQAGDGDALDHHGRQHAELDRQITCAAAAAVPFRPITIGKVTGKRQCDGHQQQRPDEAAGDRLIHHAIGHRVIARADEPGDHRRGAERDEAEHVAHEPQRVDHQRHRGDVRFARQKVARQPQVGEADQHVQHLLDEHRQRQPQHRPKCARAIDEAKWA